MKEESKKNQKLNVGLDNEMDVEKSDVNKEKKNKKIISVKKQMKLKAKEKLIARRKIFKKK